MDPQNHNMEQHRGQKGFAMAYILAIITLASLATLLLATTQRGQAQAQLSAELRSVLLDQASLIRTRIIGCVIAYPAGDNGSGFHNQYPATPASTLVSDLTCPGQSGANNLWTGTDGLFLPTPHRAYSDWKYINDANSIRLTITSAVASDSAARNAMDAVAKRLGNIASVSSDTLTIVLRN